MIIIIIMMMMQRMLLKCAMRFFEWMINNEKMCNGMTQLQIERQTPRTDLVCSFSIFH